ncbi:unnamed protein product [Lepeophtheirus salmonis]|uniref:(salmon louse) hypothetical protein n=1 Tax=Lepeophtheirus salmonis TaxID=72036 RepID=A0A7R8CF98_LEPSM|nr:unnamed protein product [Lepeophtheirus salmonis]CAF2804585.1 unnamed protein product [Lepeophtheirus salmonis]
MPVTYREDRSFVEIRLHSRNPSELFKSRKHNFNSLFHLFTRISFNHKRNVIHVPKNDLFAPSQLQREEEKPDTLVCNFFPTLVDHHGFNSTRKMKSHETKLHGYD